MIQHMACFIPNECLCVSPSQRGFALCRADSVQRAIQGSPQRARKTSKLTHILAGMKLEVS